MKNRIVGLVTAGLFLSVYFGIVPTAQRAAEIARRPGPIGTGTTLLPNGWRIAPVGRHLTVGDLPLAFVASPDGRDLIITNNGYSKPTLTIVDTETFSVKSNVPVEHAWLGLGWHPDGKRLYSTGQNQVEEFAYEAGTLKPLRTFGLPKSPTALGGGLAVAPDGTRVLVIRALEQQLLAIALDTGEITKTVTLPAEAYTCLFSADGKRLFVSLWGGARVLAFDAETLEQVAEAAVGEHPNAMVLSKKGDRLFVACANTNAVWVIDLASMAAKEQIGVAMFPNAPAGTTPNGLALSPDGRTLLVANADNNTVAVVDVATAGRSQVSGFIPAGWYPTAVGFDRDGRQVYVLSGKGLSSSANPHGPSPLSGRTDQYIGGLLKGSLSVLPLPEGDSLSQMTKTAISLSPYSDATRLAPAGAPRVSSIPTEVGKPSPIKYVFYIIRENRTYDQVLGDLENGNGDPSLCLFGADVTPNAHALAREFALFDNFFVDAEVSYDGHAFSTAAYATDVVEKIWPANYAGRGGAYLSEGGGTMRNAYGNVAAPAQGYIWDACRRANVAVRSYGEFVMHGVDSRDTTSPLNATVPGLVGAINPDFPPFDMEITDQVRADIWLKEFRAFEASGGLPRLTIMRLPRDHTTGTRARAVTPRSMVADNDLALGRVVDAISHSRFWKESAIFVLEDDAQNGPDHVDAHRSVLLVASPFVRRGAVDGTLYTTSGVLRTIELILGLPPMSQYDAAATPLYNAFVAQPDTKPYAAVAARVPLDDRNGTKAPGAAESAAMDFSAPDRAPDLLLNEVIWKSVKGANAVMPPPRRAAFVRPAGDRN
ncbi:MAG TPA: bifunctional YncE family protein/alkaline phosphatase family protein [Vicinamibacterales bacterium]